MINVLVMKLFAYYFNMTSENWYNCLTTHKQERTDIRRDIENRCIQSPSQSLERCINLPISFPIHKVE